MANHVKIDMKQLILSAELSWKKLGRVNWSALAREFGVTRAAIQFRVAKAVKDGKIPRKVFDRWSQSEDKAEAALKVAEKVSERYSNMTRVTLKPENKAWLAQEAARRHRKTSYIINELLADARTAQERAHIRNNVAIESALAEIKAMDP